MIIELVGADLVPDPALASPYRAAGPFHGRCFGLTGRQDGPILPSEMPPFGRFFGDVIDLLLPALDALEVDAQPGEAAGEPAEVDPFRCHPERFVGFPKPEVRVPQRDGDAPGVKVLHIQDRLQPITRLEDPQLGEDPNMVDLDVFPLRVMQDGEVVLHSVDGDMPPWRSIWVGQVQGMFGIGEGHEPRFLVDSFACPQQFGPGTTGGIVPGASITRLLAVRAAQIFKVCQGESEDVAADFGWED